MTDQLDDTARDMVAAYLRHKLTERFIGCAVYIGHERDRAPSRNGPFTLNELRMRCDAIIEQLAHIEPVAANYVAAVELNENDASNLILTVERKR